MKATDRITDLEERVRDRILGPLVLLVVPGWVKPNHITFLRVILVCLAIGMFVVDRPIHHQAWALITAALTDSVDGILARVRKQISRSGAYLDHAADWFLGVWTGILVLINGLLPSAFIILIVIPQLGIVVVDRLRASCIAGESMGKRALTIAMGAANFRPSAFSRFQFFTILLGFFLLLFSRVWGYPKLQWLGLGSLYTAACLAWFLLVDGSLRLFRENRQRC